MVQSYEHYKRGRWRGSEFIRVSLRFMDLYINELPLRDRIGTQNCTFLCKDIIQPKNWPLDRPRIRAYIDACPGLCDSIYSTLSIWPTSSRHLNKEFFLFSNY